VVRNNDRIPSGDELRAACQKLVDDAQDLRRIAGLNILRAANIAEKDGDGEVVRLLVSEASVMMSVASQIEWLFVAESDTDDNL
jgi:Cdc6-like AAA superfamily ATPase